MLVAALAPPLLPCPLSLVRPRLGPRLLALFLLALLALLALFLLVLSRKSGRCYYWFRCEYIHHSSHFSYST